jgi:hypothetical protein
LRTRSVLTPFSYTSIGKLFILNEMIQVRINWLEGQRCFLFRPHLSFKMNYP